MEIICVLYGIVSNIKYTISFYMPLVANNSSMLCHICALPAIIPLLPAKSAVGCRNLFIDILPYITYIQINVLMYTAP